MANTLKVLLCPPGSKPRIFEINNDATAIEEFLQGPLEIKILEEDGLCLLFNEEAHKRAFELNRVVDGDPIFGDCIFCRKQGDKLYSLTDEELSELENLLV